MDYQIKFNNITDLADARFAASVMAEWMGFSVGKPTDLSIPQIQEIINWCSGPKLTLELEPNLAASQVFTYCNALPVEAIECNLEQYQALTQLQGIEFILTQPGPHITHLTKEVNSNNITKITELNPDFITDNEVENFSLTCIPAPTGLAAGEKDFEDFYVFFEALGIL